jgi:hypothetical protein
MSNVLNFLEEVDEFLEIMHEQAEDFELQREVVNRQKSTTPEQWIEVQLLAAKRRVAVQEMEFVRNVAAGFSGAPVLYEITAEGIGAWGVAGSGGEELEEIVGEIVG